MSHVVTWTGLTADMRKGAKGPLSWAALLANVPAYQQPAAIASMKQRNATGLPIYVIADRWVCDGLCFPEVWM